MDTGSGCSLLKRSVSTVLGLSGPPTTLRLSVAGGAVLGETKERIVEFQLMSLDKRFVTIPLEGITCKRPAEPFPPVTLNPNIYAHLNECEFTFDYPQKRKVPIDLILTSSVVYALQIGAIVQSTFDVGPAAAHYRLGTALVGSYIEMNDTPNKSKMIQPVYFCGTAVDEETRDPFNVKEIKDFVRLEQLGITDEEDSEYTLAEMEAIELFHSSLRYDESTKQYTVKLLWKEDPKDFLDNNVSRALAVCHGARRRLATQPELTLRINDAYWEQYNRQMAVIVPPQDWRPERPTYTMPSRPVYREGSTSTPIRVVLDGSAKCKSTGYSLNQILHAGPSLLPDIAKLMLRFRQTKYVCTCDCSRMFWRIKIAEEDRCFLRYLWQFADNEDPIMFESIVMVFGLIDSPYKSMECVHEHCRRFEAKFPLAAKTILESLYLDDASAVANCIEFLGRIAKQMYELFELASMPTHKWNSNCVQVRALSGIPAELWSSETTQKFLGLLWDTVSDSIQFSFNDIVKVPDGQSTKRSMLSEFSACYDPLGLVSPWVMKAKVLFQQLWSIPDMTWDSRLPPSIEKEWEEWRQEAKQMITITLPRLCANPDEPKWLAVFSDGSNLGFSAVAYVVGKSSSHIIFAKSKVAPTKLSQKEKNIPTLSIARMELLGTVIAARIAVFLRSAFPPDYFTKVRFFTDSLITFYRLQRGHANYKVWVANRLREVENKAGVENFRFTPGELNPSDCNCRHLTINELKNNLIWWNGPNFLLKEEEFWPIKKSLTAAEALKELGSDFSHAEEFEKRSIDVSNIVFEARILKIQQAQSETQLSRFEKHFSSWRRLIIATAWIFRYLLHCLAKSKTSGRLKRLFAEWSRALRAPRFADSDSAYLQSEELAIQAETDASWLDKPYITANEFNCAECYWILQIQRVAFPQAFANPQRLQEFHKLDNYNARFDAIGLIRGTSRLQLSLTMPRSAINPVILPKRTRLVELLVLNRHSFGTHLPKNQTYYRIKMQFLLAGGRPECSRILKLCTDAVCNPPRLLQQQWAPLPAERTDSSIPFEFCLADFAGPIEVFTKCFHDGENRETKRKAYILVLTCYHTRAVALELCEDLRTETFLAALNRAQGRTGRVSMITSDNALTFKAADRYLKSLYRKIEWDKVCEDQAARGTRWKFGIPLSPWGQGAVEALVGTVKKALSLVLKNRRLTPMQYLTVLYECEAWINDRPLGTIADSKDSLLPLTPSMLTRQRLMGALPHDPTPLKEVSPKDRITRMMVHRRILQSQLWRRFQQEYLLRFQVSRLVASKNMPQLEVGKVVHLREKNLKPGKWQLARVIELFPGSDGKVRRVKLKTASGAEIVRHVNDLAFQEWEIPTSAIDANGNGFPKPRTDPPAPPLTRPSSRRERGDNLRMTRSRARALNDPSQAPQ